MTKSNPVSVDLHVHLRGTTNPDTAKFIAKRNNVHLPTSHIGDSGQYVWRNFQDFLTVYDLVGKVVRRSEDLFYLAKKYLLDCASQGTVYVEFMLSPDHSIENGISYGEQIGAVAGAIADAKSISGIEGRLIVTCVRHRGPEVATELAEIVAENPSPIVVGFGMTGNERRFDAAEFEAAFMVAGEAGLGLTAHTGEWCNARSVLHSVEKLGLERVGHGVRAVEDPAILNELVAREVGFEVCLSSNVAMGICKSIEYHPLPRLIDAGCRVSLGSDDPAYFCTNPANEYRLAAEIMGLPACQMRQLTEYAIEMAFCDADTKRALRERLEEEDVRTT